MVAVDYQGAVRAGTMAAARLHQQLDLRQEIEAVGGNVDVFAAIHTLDLPLLVRPLQGLLGAYLSEPGPGNPGMMPPASSFSFDNSPASSSASKSGSWRSVSNPNCDRKVLVVT